MLNSLRLPSTTAEGTSGPKKINLGHNVTTKHDQVLIKTKENLRTIITHTNATPLRGRRGIGYECSFCCQQFPDPTDLKKHTREHYKTDALTNETMDKIVGVQKTKLCVKLDITNLQCRVCNLFIHSMDKLYDHLEQRHDKPIHRDINDHIFPFKFNSEDLCCCICSKQYNSFKTLLEHMNVHSTNYECNICCATFVNKDKLRIHRSTHDDGEFKCKYCPKVLKTKQRRACHERVHTTASKTFKCGYCGERFSDQRPKLDHLFKEHGVPLPKPQDASCKICAKDFSHKKALNTHIRRVHLLERLHKCQFCEMEFFGLNELKKHILKHTGEKSFQCDICLKSYGRKHTLREHMRIHANDRRFKCDKCGQAFVQKCSLYGHMRAKHNVSW